MKKMMVLLMVMAMLLTSTVSALGEAAGDSTVMIPEVTPVTDEIGVQPGTEVVIGNTTGLAGYFATDLWNNNTVDMDARALIHGYATVAWTDAYGMALDGTVVRSLNTEAMADGSKRYTLTLAEGLTYNDGTEITAKDYVFSLLLTGSNAIHELGGTPRGLAHIVGYEAYRSGEAQELSGLSLLPGNAFSITVKPEYESYFYALALLNVTPYPIDVIAPGCDIYDDGAGAYIGAAADAGEIDASTLPYTPGEFGAAMLNETMLNAETGYVFNPRVTSGPYSLESHDAARHEASFIINERYAGNFEGQKPHIERLVMRKVENETMVEELAKGNVDLLNKVISGITVTEGLSLRSQEGAQMASYLRTGFAFLSFACEDGVASSAAVRKAISHCLDKPTYVASSVGSVTALPVHGYYGVGQWMTVQAFDADEAAGKDELNVSDELAKLEVPYDLEAAQALLASDGWTLNEYGEAYDAEAGGIRYREVDGELEPLVIRWAKTENNRLADATQVALEWPLAVLGIDLEVTELPFDEVLRQYYRQDERAYDMFFMASNFSYVFDPYVDFNTGDEYQGLINTTGLKDDELMQLALEMRQTHPTQTREYTEKWLAFQARFVELMPMVPLYSNVYFDFYATDLQDYKIPLHSSWAYAIPYAWIGEAPQVDDDGLLTGDDLGDVDDDIVFVD